MTLSFRTLAALAVAAVACAACQTGPGVPVAAEPPPPKLEGRLCAGIAGLRCGPGEYCQIPWGQCRAVADAAGVCRPLPEVCNANYAPVCGCDGRTYSNACRAGVAGASVAARGACKP